MRFTGIIFFILIFIILSNNFLLASPTLSFDQIKTYALNKIIISNLNYNNKATFEIFAYTYTKKKELIFKAKLNYFIKNFSCYFYANPDFERIELNINLDSQEKYNYNFKVNPNRYAETDLEKYSFNEKSHYEIVNPYDNITSFKILTEYNPDYYGLLSNTFLHYYDKKKIDGFSISIFSFFILFSLLFINFIKNKNIKFILLLIFVLILSYYMLFNRNQNFVLKGYMQNPFEQGNIEDSKIDTTIDIPLSIELSNKTDYNRFLNLNLVSSETKIVKIYQKEYSMLFAKLFFQNQRIPLNDIDFELMYFKSLPDSFCIVYENNNYFIVLDKILIFGRLGNQYEE